MASNGTFKETVMLMHEPCINRFHPTLPVLVSGSIHVILFDAKNGIIPFSSWNERKGKLRKNDLKSVCSLEWNVDGTKLAAGVADPYQLFANESGDESGEIIVWSYPDGDILLKRKQLNSVHEIEWNQFRQEVFATYNIGDQLVSLWTTKDPERNLLYTFDFSRDDRFREYIMKVKWIAKSEIALGLNSGTIEIYQIDENQPVITPQITRKLKHDRVVRDMKWNDATQCLVSYSWDNTIKIWSVDHLNVEPIHGIQVNSSCYIYSLAWCTNEKTHTEVNAARKSPENFILACGLRDMSDVIFSKSDRSVGLTGSIFIWNPLERDESKKLRLLQKHKCPVFSLAFSPDGHFLASSDAISIIIWSTETWMPFFVSQCHHRTRDRFWTGQLSWMALGSSAGGNKLICSSIDNQIHVFESVEETFKRKRGN